MAFKSIFSLPEPPNEVTWAEGRLPHRTYISRSFTLNLPASRDHGEPARYVTKVFDEPTFDDASTTELDNDIEEYIVATTPRGRKQIQLQVAREAGNVRRLVIQRVPTNPGSSKLEVLLDLDRTGATRLIDVIRMVNSIPVEGDTSVRIDDQVLQDFFRDPEAMTALYGRDPGSLRRLIELDASAADVIAISRRRTVVGFFRRLLEDSDLFDEVAADHSSPEKVWQNLFEMEPWLLGANLAGQLITSWSPERLEQVVTGASISGPGKRTDALMRTNGRISAMIFAEIKHHRTLLVDKEYRSGCWAPSTELSGGVVQIQQTVHLATREIQDRLADKDGDGVETGEYTYVVRPRSFLIVGSLDQLRGQGGIQKEKYESFELYRRNLYEPEIVTFDELLARAEWQCTLLET
ncbi:hypothetical protein TS71_17355 [Mycolicibacterium neoaurum]|uniref:Shedu protein SduA C-terminal domain-containing protein n=1 Tax=Mycolicibacterium neoaurum VKM Ac-1815D TaxID=700508 RepID=V5XA56_MYCNE|nr:hypothetical protein D174_08975 [Mycolicibacterium neoaurum VKM Ac-1815D]AMO05264.1 hypothetical protein MyAD_08815 [Mycolicibacterium neoaurum]AXK76427.1 DUF4263 domain-containing protein [Mycolicibacterium neoaurum]KJQ49303.1 hypothetical protein TS71_17355 [Mycolicibacterium neoaurum]KUM08432.1 hypothetical protein AVZ31_10510 [Mycolicibacterium neoaurum]